VKRLWIALFVCAAALSAEEKAAAPEENMTWVWVNFAILAVALGYLCSKMFPPFFKSRTAAIQQGIREAQAVKKEADARAAEMEGRLKTLGAEIEKFRTQANAEMQQEGARIRHETERQMTRIQQQGQAEIETATKIARRELQAYAAKLALDLAEQRLRARVDEPTDAALVGDFISEMEASKN
jgi:F-type H+-transporting ATPase subunit b